jgi:hypothetical protein
MEETGLDFSYQRLRFTLARIRRGRTAFLKATETMLEAKLRVDLAFERLADRAERPAGEAATAPPADNVIPLRR